MLPFLGSRPEASCAGSILCQQYRVGVPTGQMSVPGLELCGLQLELLAAKSRFQYPIALRVALAETKLRIPMISPGCTDLISPGIPR
ncbi:hypothetical protein BSZ22_21150 [Bradyrhizobium canariense]|nr:hypothetical protein BSZ22_21150 [Bradyrhizobium canariense]OSI78108.1 hypothetical protein BSZ23_20150 [Bradyrhizobium canariense]OSI89338.1 hypothetical protein BSZ25_21620 [Bradyrhizobium canariense]OSI93168.1 hypothetical protein BSZ24_13740 [Bradyrhizobium canariense]OSJ03137.1 hypothetical protein BSZ16_17045 [Bradyrhizobium canariense]